MRQVLSTFDQVVKKYNDTKPVISVNYTAADDVRPIGSRRRPWERIKKIDDNTYAFIDGVHGTTLCRANPNAADHSFENIYAPITWMRRVDGDYIRLHNQYERSASVLRYQMFYDHLPVGITLRKHDGSGCTFTVRTKEGYVDCLLPKSSVRWDAAKREHSPDDHRELIFRVEGDGVFTRVSEPMTVPSKRIDTDLKKTYAPHIADFQMFCASIAPLLDLSWQARTQYTKDLRDERTKRSLNNYELYREIVVDAEHPLRVAMAAEVLSNIRGIVNTEDDLRRAKAQFNAQMNRFLGLFRQVNV